LKRREGLNLWGPESDQGRNPIGIFNGMIAAFTLATATDSGMIMSASKPRARRGALKMGNAI
jgi:hypothetical protein